ncbi:MAG: hypothetical protein Q4A81_04435 [Pasteurellaceae bacterium]|nr:hypothetical protein [Pasteurellaceae bacterium]
MVSKRRKLFNLSAIALIVAVGAQFYTNYKIDRVLQQFPYHINNEFTLQVNEQNSDFFTRDLTFSLQSEQSQTEFIHTKLTALPFMITAESELLPAIVKQLNQKLDITIDKNSINSHISVFSDSLSTDMQTQFRDLTNTQQNVETELVYTTKNKRIDLQLDLSGLKSENAQLKNVSGKFRFLPISESKYDLVRADSKVENLEINSLDGSNNQIQAQNMKFALNRQQHEENYDITTKFTADTIAITNQITEQKENKDNTTKDLDKIQINNIDLSSKKINVANEISFFNLPINPEQNKIDLKAIFHYIQSSLFDNDQVEVQSRIKEIDFSNLGKLKEMTFNFNSAHKNKSDADLQLKWSLGQADFIHHQSPMEKVIEGLSFSHTLTHFDLASHLAFFEQFIPQYIDQIGPKTKSNKEFINAIDKLSQQDNSEAQISISLESAKLDQVISLNKLKLNSEEKFDREKDRILNPIQLSVDKLNFDIQKIMLDKIKFNLTNDNIQPTKELQRGLFCNAVTYKLLCMNNLSTNDFSHMIEEFIHYFSGNLKGDLTMNIDTLPNSKTYPLQADMNLQIIQTEKDVWSKLKNALFTIQFPTGLVADMNREPINESGKLKQDSAFWKWLNQTTQTYFIQEQEIYKSNLKFKDGEFFINGIKLNLQEK